MRTVACLVSLLLVAIMATPSAWAAEKAVKLYLMPDQPDSPATPMSPAEYAKRHQGAHRFDKFYTNARGKSVTLASQTAIWKALAGFHSPVSLSFIDWSGALLTVEQLASGSDACSVVEIGDGWLPYLESLGAVAYSRRFTHDFRLLFYRSDMVSDADAAGLSTWDGFESVCNRVRARRPRGLEAPFGLSIADWDALHNLAIWLYNAGVPSLVGPPRWMPWQPLGRLMPVASFAEGRSREAADYLANLVRQGSLALSEGSTESLTGGFLSGRYAIVLAPTSLISKAGDQLPLLRSCLPPAAPGIRQHTFSGGALLVVLAPQGRRSSPDCAAARALVDHLCSPTVQTALTRELAAVPGNVGALAGWPETYQKLVAPALTPDAAVAYPPLRGWAKDIEERTVRSAARQFWMALALPEAEKPGQTTIAHRQLALLVTIINEKLAPGRWPLWAAMVLTVILIGSLGWNWVQQRRIRALRALRDAYANYLHARDKQQWADGLCGVLATEEHLVTLDFGASDVDGLATASATGGDDA